MKDEEEEKGEGEKKKQEDQEQKETGISSKWQCRKILNSPPPTDTPLKKNKGKIPTGKDLKTS